jgi:hypothetical protein
MPEERKPLGDGGAVLGGSVAGLLAGIGLGGLIVVLSGNFSLVTALIVVIHAAAAMMLMGGWSAPALLSRDE